VSAGRQSPIERDDSSDSCAEREHDQITLALANTRQHFASQGETGIVGDPERSP
jgi:hypothetical protein